MKTILILLVCSSLVFAKPSSKSPSSYKLTNDFNQLDLFEKLGDKINNLKSNWTASCQYCNQFFDQLHQAFQDPSVKEFFLDLGKLNCPDESCIKVVEDVIESITKETDVKKGCKPVCDYKEPMRMLIKEIEVPREIISFSFPRIAESLTSAWDKLACSQCHKYYSFLHEKFMDPTYKDRFMAFGKKICPNEKCLLKLEALIESITKETDENKACEPVCKN